MRKNEFEKEGEGQGGGRKNIKKKDKICEEAMQIFNILNLHTYVHLIPKLSEKQNIPLSSS